MSFVEVCLKKKNCVHVQKKENVCEIPIVIAIVN